MTNSIPEPESPEQERGRLAFLMWTSAILCSASILLLFTIYGWGAALIGIVLFVVTVLLCLTAEELSTKPRSKNA